MGALPVVLLLVIGFTIYFLPSFIAYSREHPSQTGIIVLNFFLGWTFIGWVCALVWAFTVKTPEAQAVAMTSPHGSKTKNCSFCAEPVRLEAIKCKHCGSMLVEGVFNDQAAPVVTADGAQAS